jgi:hypothetical protein
MALVLKQTMQIIKQQNMKKIFLLFSLACAFSMASNAQCDKRVLYTSAKQEWLNSKDEIQKSDEDKVTVEISKTSIILNHNDDPNDVMKGDIKNLDCNWNEAYKTGKSVIQAKLMEGANDVHDATITIEGKNGILFILIEMKDHPDMIIKAYIDKYTEEG